jgi:hypothetical protein
MCPSKPLPSQVSETTNEYAITEGKYGVSVPARERKRSLRFPWGLLLVEVCPVEKRLVSTARMPLRTPWATVLLFPAEVYTTP